MTEIPILTTERLTLRGPEPEDFGAYAAFRMSARAKGVGGPYTRAEATVQFADLTAQWERLGYGRWIVTDRASDEPLGVVGILHPEDWPEPELAWSLFKAAEGRGIAFEAATAARAHAYGILGMTTLISFVDPANTRSAALAERLGARPDGMFDIPNHGKTPVWRHPGPENLQ